MAETDPPTPPAARPNRPTTAGAERAVESSRPGRPGMRPVAAVAPTTVVAPPPPAEVPFTAPPAAPRRRSPPVWAGVALRRTLVPPCLVLGVSAVALGGAYFAQAPDAALRQMGPAVPIGLLITGVLTLAVAAGLMLSLRGPGPIDSPPAAS